MSIVATVIVACRNERAQISRCLESILAGDFPKESLEILVVDGMSTDGTREIVACLARLHSSIRLLDNPRQTTAAAFNIGVRESAGEVVLIMSTHARYAPDYVSSCVRHLQDYSADDVGGSMITVPDGDGVAARGIAGVLSHPFGVGNARFRLPLRAPTWVDTVFGGCYRREVFSRIGSFDERLVRGWDMDFNSRLRRNGGRILLVPSIKVWYIPKDGLRGFVRQNFRDGVWAVRAIPLAGRGFRLRHFVPLGFVSALVASALLAVLWPPMLWILIGILGAYALLAMGSGIQLAIQEGDARLVLVTPLLFAVRHGSYGVGSLLGLLGSALSFGSANAAERQPGNAPESS